MRTSHLHTHLVFIATVLSLISCEPDEQIINPPHDCSYDHTVAAINEDTTYTVGCVSISPVNHYPEGYVVRAVSFNPNNKDQMAILVSIGDHEPSNDDFELGIYNLCSNTYQTIVTDISLDYNNLQWSRSGRILFKDGSKFRTINPDGTGNVELALTSSYAAFILNDGRLIFYKGNLVITDSLGVPIDTIITFPSGGMPMDILPDGKILLDRSSELQLLDPITGAVTVIDNTSETNYSHAVYVESDNAIFWVTYNQIAFPGAQEKLE